MPTESSITVTDEASGVEVETVQIDGTDHVQCVNPRPVVARLSSTPTISTTAYAAKDAIGGVLTFSAAARYAGGAVRIEAVQLVDKGQQMSAIDLVLFDRTVTAPTDNAAFDPTDTELGYVVGRIPISPGHYADLSDNAVATVNNVGIVAMLNGADLFGVLVARETPTYTSTGDIVVTVTVTRF